MAELIAARRVLSVAELASHFGISAPTTRRDLAVLEHAGLASRTHGGVVAPGEAGAPEPLFLEKLRVHQNLKSRIGTAAAGLVKNQQTMMLDSGTTCLALARAIAGRPLNVVTVDLKVAEAAAMGSTEVHLVGGRVRNGYYSLVGSWAMAALERIRCDIFFMAADAIDVSGVSNSTPEEADVKRAAIARAGRTVLLADHSKLNSRSFVEVCALDAVERFVTDRGAEPLLEPYRPLIRAIETC